MSYVPSPFFIFLIRSFISFLPSKLKTTLLISLFANSMTSSSINNPFVVNVNLKFLSFLSSMLRAYSTVFLHTSQFNSGSPPKKSTSKFLLPVLFSTKKSMAFFAVSNDINPLVPQYSPSPAKQYWQFILQSWATCKQIAFNTKSLLFIFSAIVLNSSSLNSLPLLLNSCTSSTVSTTSFIETFSYLSLIFSNIISLSFSTLISLCSLCFNVELLSLSLSLVHSSPFKILS